MLTSQQIHWVAGIVEGEGCLGIRPSGRTFSPRLEVKMADEDVIAKLAYILGRRYAYCNEWAVKNTNRQKQYKVAVTGPSAIGWALTLYPLMGLRRRKKIREVVSYWRTHGKFSQEKISNAEF